MAEHSAAFNRVVKKAENALLIERAWPRAVPPLGIAGLFLTTSWLNAWMYLPPGGRIAGVVAFTAAFLASPLMIKTGPLRVSRNDALRRIDGNNGDPSLPAQTLANRPAQNSATAQELWDDHVRMVWAKWGDRLDAGRVRSVMPERDRYKLRYIIAAATAVSLVASGDDWSSRLAVPFDWKTPPTPVTPITPVEPKPLLAVKAWVTPPAGIDHKIITLDEKTKDAHNGGDALIAHETSTMTIRIPGAAAAISVNGAAISVQKIIAPRVIDQGQSTYQYEFQLRRGNTVVKIEGGPEWHIQVMPDNEPVIRLHAARPDPENPNALQLNFSASDDFGTQDGEIIMRLPGRDPAATPLPSGAVPRISLP